jgi:hypothetical protein
LDDKGMFTAGDLAARFLVDPEALRKRLERWRKMNTGGGGWIENTDATSREPRYSYQLGRVRHIIAAMSASDDASGERPA